VTAAPGRPGLFGIARRDVLLLALALAASITSGVFTSLSFGPVLTFVVSAVAIALLASLVGRATEHLSSRLGPGATGVLQSALGNLPELFICIFALRAGLVKVVQTALIGSILANSLLVLGIALLVGGLKNGTQKFSSAAPRMTATLMLLAVSALAVPTLAYELHTPAAIHIDALDVACALVLLALFVASIPFLLKGDPAVAPSRAPERASHESWSLGVSIVVLAIAGIGAGFVSEWFVAALEPTIAALHLSEAFTGLVVVAIAGNAVENVVGVQLAARNKVDYAMSVILNSSLQVALGLIPVLVLLSFVLGGAILTLVVPPLLIVALTLAALLSAFIVYDGESIWLEGAALIGLYIVIAASFWWG
jgi:Ca2+:H+ antiporter